MSPNPASTLSYWPINKEFLNKNSDQQFTLYLKENSQPYDLFVKFAGPDPAHQEKVRKMLNEGELDNSLYIHKDEMQEYFSQASERIKEWEKAEEGNPEALAKKLHGLCLDIMKGFFEFNVSSKVLKLIDPIMEKMQQCLTESNYSILNKTLAKDFSLYTHCVNVGLYCLSFGVYNKIKPEEVHSLGMGGLFCDIGMSTVPVEILQKKTALNKEEEEIVKQHINKGKEILKELDFSDSVVLEIVENHHEEFEGGGYPKGASGNDIPYNARICKIMDMYNDFTSPRESKKALLPIQALTKMTTEYRPQFDPELLKQFILMMGPSLD
ncbi:MAG: HD domain-containing protein [Candidatus Nitronauta litoralis]|uniref:HD domain-containing protein n=1 Tax=Candidatus Nitronauta litoralis TaxID=2705533 RepID=A0A7T0G081_9BACT|nr:MAG: HD domain-containing protein [Candidatus Nitronauta litoralis]